MNKLRTAFTPLALLAPLILAVSCRTAPPRMTDAMVVPVYYATDRKPLMPLEVWHAKLPRKGSRWQYYGAEYNPAQLELGVCPISVPTAKHAVGVVERPGWPGRQPGGIRRRCRAIAVPRSAARDALCLRD